MYIRCGSCHGSLWVEGSGVAEQVFTASCPTCGKKYRLEGGHSGGDAGELLAQEARQLVRETNLDLPSAYSVLLGVTTLEEVLELAGPGASPSPPDGAFRGHAKMAGHDPAFQPAIESGCLTALQAMQRGSRQGYASLVARRYRLSPDVALEVADNRTSLLEAVRKRGPEPGPPVQLTVAASASRSWLSWVVASVVVGAIVIVGLQYTKRSSPTSGAGQSVRSVKGAEVHTDEWGRILRVLAADPKSVLAGYCAADQDRRFEAIDVVPSSRGEEGGRLGLLRRTGRAAEVLSIEIREDRAANRWVAGDGTSPLVPRTAPRGAADAISRP